MVPVSPFLFILSALIDILNRKNALLYYDKESTHHDYRSFPSLYFTIRPNSIHKNFGSLLGYCRSKKKEGDEPLHQRSK